MKTKEQQRLKARLVVDYEYGADAADLETTITADRNTFEIMPSALIDLARAHGGEISVEVIAL